MPVMLFVCTVPTLAEHDTASALQTWFRAHPMAPCCRIFESYCESMGLELMHVKFLRQSGARVQGCELLMDLKLGDEETLAMLPVQPNNTEGDVHRDSD